MLLWMYVVAQGAVAVSIMLFCLKLFLWVHWLWMLFLGGKIASNAASVDVVLCMHRVLLTFADAVGAGAMYADAACCCWMCNWCSPYSAALLCNGKQLTLLGQNAEALKHSNWSITILIALTLYVLTLKSAHLCSWNIKCALEILQAVHCFCKKSCRFALYCMAECVTASHKITIYSAPAPINWSFR